MPELPEVETIKKFLEKKLIGQRIEKVKILSPKQFLGSPQKIKGLEIKKIKRRAKLLVIYLEKNLYLLIHLKLTGQLVYSRKIKGQKAVFGHPIPFAGGKTLPGKTTRIIIKLNRGIVFFNDLRKFGWIKITNNLKDLEKIGPEPLSSRFTLQALAQILQKSKRPVKLVLLDQDKIAGIGNIYANEALWLAKINPQKPANEIKKIKELYWAIQETLKKGIKYQGSSAADEAYIRPNGGKGEYQKHFRVYQQEGRPCPRDKTPIKRIKINNRGTFYCPACQAF